MFTLDAVTEEPTEPFDLWGSIDRLWLRWAQEQQLIQSFTMTQDDDGYVTAYVTPIQPVSYILFNVIIDLP